MLTSWLEAWDTPGLGGSALSLHHRLKVALTLTSPSAEPSFRPSIPKISVPLLRFFSFSFSFQTLLVILLLNIAHYFPITVCIQQFVLFSDAQHSW